MLFGLVRSLNCGVGGVDVVKATAEPVPKSIALSLGAPSLPQGCMTALENLKPVPLLEGDEINNELLTKVPILPTKDPV